MLIREGCIAEGLVFLETVNPNEELYGFWALIALLSKGKDAYDSMPKGGLMERLVMKFNAYQIGAYMWHWISDYKDSKPFIDGVANMIENNALPNAVGIESLIRDKWVIFYIGDVLHLGFLGSDHSTIRPLYSDVQAFKVESSVLLNLV